VEGGTLVVAGMVPVSGDSPLGAGTGAGIVKVGDPQGAQAARLLLDTGITMARDLEVVSNSAGLARLGGKNQSVYSGNVVLNTNAVIFTETSGSRVKFAGVISGNGGLTTSGGGILEMANANTYSGGTVVTNATLLANNASGWATGAGLTRITNTGTLGGTGAVFNTQFDGGRVAPGDVSQVGQLSLSNTTWNSGTRYAWNLDLSQGATPGTGWDFLAVSNVTLNSGTFYVDVSLLSLSGFDTTPSGTNEYLIAKTFDTGTWNTNQFAAINTWSGGTPTNGFGWWLDTKLGGTELYLKYGAGLFDYYSGPLVIPEPNLLTLLLSGLGAIYAARRRLKKR
jgi:autotransporter-associated beta strand protein